MRFCNLARSRPRSVSSISSSLSSTMRMVMGVEAPDMPPILERRRGRLKARPARAPHVAMTGYESSPHCARGRYSPGDWERTLGEGNDELDGCQDPAGAHRGGRG